ncbi:MAG: ABC transporter permease [Bacteroidales bacterium]|nr:ABC transporter permease [Bacteroidales bacterium]
MIQFINRYLHDMEIAFESILANKLRSMLTALGIIFGVAAVISMMAIGNGAQQEILDQIKMVGVNNIIITPIIPEEESESASTANTPTQSKKFSRGLTMLDAESIRDNVPTVKVISPEISMTASVVQGGTQMKSKVVGVSKEYFQLFNMPIEDGYYFNDLQEEDGSAVCVIGANIRARFFPQSDPINQYIKFGAIWLKVIGVLERNQINVSASTNTGVNVTNDNIYIPVKTYLMRFNNRAVAQTKRSEATMIMGGRGGGGGMMIIASGSESTSATSNVNTNQLDKIVVQVKETQDLTASVEIISRMLERRHNQTMDFEITVPELLLKQQQRTREVFNIVLGAIAGISLLVGGIGIMNIMFATVMERIKEIGTRMAIGAKKMDIVMQFLSEAIFISVTGGLAGIILGVVAAKLITHFTGILTIMSISSIFVSFFVSASIGIIFGYSPAKRASERDPIESLRYE